MHRSQTQLHVQCMVQFLHVHLVLQVACFGLLLASSTCCWQLLAAGKQYLHQQQCNKASAPIMTHRSLELSSSSDVIPGSGPPS